MKKFEEVKAVIEELRAEAKKVKEEIDKVQGAEKSFLDNNRLIDIKTDEELNRAFHDFKETIDNLYIKESHIERLIKVWNNNAAASFWYGKIDQAIDIINKYAGKKIGEKTNEKIDKELETLQINVRFSSNKILFYAGILRYEHREIYVYKKHECGINFFDENNKLLPINKDDLLQYGKFFEDYIDNPEEYINKKLEVFTELKKQLDELQRKISDYNNNNILGINDIPTINTCIYFD